MIDCIFHCMQSFVMCHLTQRLIDFSMRTHPRLTISSTSMEIGNIKFSPSRIVRKGCVKYLTEVTDSLMLSWLISSQD